MRNLKVWKLILQSLENEVPVMLIHVLESKGSSPGRRGFSMAVSGSGEMEGSIGGGIMEHKWVELAKQKLRERGEVENGKLKRQVHDKKEKKDHSGMICSGEQTLLLYPVRKEDQTWIRELIDSLERNQNGTLVLSSAGAGFRQDMPEYDFNWEFKSENDWIYTEKTGYRNHISIIGGGHCSLALSSLMRSLDFYVRVYEERQGLKTLRENSTAHETFIVPGYSKINDWLPELENHYVVIMTFGYRTDDVVLRSLTGRHFKYLGLLGSRKKIETMMEEYGKDSIDPDWLRKVHAPIGLHIHSQTPEEIAVSIAAEIIAEKNSVVRNQTSLNR